jgi:hypothetical protein
MGREFELAFQVRIAGGCSFMWMLLRVLECFLNFL